jgi:hypothetical protein
MSQATGFSAALETGEGGDASGIRLEDDGLLHGQAERGLLRFGDNVVKSAAAEGICTTRAMAFSLNWKNHARVRSAAVLWFPYNSAVLI